MLFLHFLIERMKEKNNHIIYDSTPVSFTCYIRNLVSDFRIIVFFARIELKSRYAQTLLGPLLSYVQAFVSIIVFTLFFGHLLHITTGEVPYIIFCSIGLMAWYNFSYLTGFGGMALLNAQHLIRKLAFPKIALPMSKALVSLFELMVWFSIIIVLMIFYQIPVTVNILMLPLIVVMLLVTGLSITFWVSALSIRYRDFFQIIPYIIGFGMFVTPVFYPGTMIPEEYNFFLYFNPMAGVLECLRWSITNSAVPNIRYLLGFIPVLILFISGIVYFKKIEHKIADLI